MAVCYSCFHLAHRSCEMETLTDCFSDLLLIYIPIKHDCHVLRAISSGFFLFGIFYIKTVCLEFLIVIQP